MASTGKVAKRIPLIKFPSRKAGASQGSKAGVLLLFLPLGLILDAIGGACSFSLVPEESSMVRRVLLGFDSFSVKRFCESKARRCLESRSAVNGGLDCEDNELGLLRRVVGGGRDY